MTPVSVEGSPGRKFLGELSDGEWFLLDGVPMLKVSTRNEADVIIEFHSDEIITTGMRDRLTRVTSIEAPEKIRLCWKAKECP